MRPAAAPGAGKWRVPRPAASRSAPPALAAELVATAHEVLRVVDALGEQELAVRVSRRAGRWQLALRPGSDFGLRHVRTVVAAIEAHVARPERARIVVDGKAYRLGVRSGASRTEQAPRRTSR